MTIGTAGFQGTRLKQARLARGLYKNELGVKLGVTGTAVANYENGIDSPQEIRLARIVQCLNFPREFFFLPPWPESVGLVHWRSQASETKHAQEMTEQRMSWLCEIFAYLDDMLEFPNLNVPEVSLPEDFRQYNNNDIERAAEQTRAAWGLGDGPIPDVILALENAGIPVSAFTIPAEKQDGFSFFSRMLGRPFIGVNLLDASSARVRFDAAHELGHILLHRKVSADQANEKRSHKLIEAQAHRFASAFLFPRSRFMSEIRHVSLDYFVQYKRRWGISVAAMIVRAADLQLIGESEKSDLFRSLSRRGWRGKLREPFDDPSDMEVERPRMLRRGFETVVQEQISSPRSLRADLALPDQELKMIAGLPDTFFAQDLSIRVKPSHLSTVDLESGKIIEFPGRKSRS